MSSIEVSPDAAPQTELNSQHEEHPAHSSRLQMQWPEALTAKEWEQRFPGILDGVAVMGGAANIILQLANLAVGHGVAESRVDSGAIFKHPIKRARTTFTYLAVAMLGTTEEKILYRKAVNKSHAQVHSDANSTVKYNAFDPELQLWVAACLFFGFADSYRIFRGEMEPARKAEFYRLAEPLGTTLQVRPGMWPKDLEAFEAYWQRGLDKLNVDDKVRFFLNKLVDLRFLHPLLSRPFGPLNRLITIGFLPPQVREQMHYHWDDQRQLKFDRVVKIAGSINRLLPRFIRQLPFTAMLWDFRRRVRKGMPLV